MKTGGLSPSETFSFSPIVLRLLIGSTKVSEIILEIYCILQCFYVSTKVDWPFHVSMSSISKKLSS